jgi:hypothetical protein
MNNFYDLLQKIQKRPALYLGRKSIFSLQAFLDGYYYARREIETPLTPQELEFQEFLQWMRQKFEVETGQLWSSILLFHSADESNAIERFFSLFQEFINQKNCLENERELVESRMINH